MRALSGPPVRSRSSGYARSLAPLRLRLGASDGARGKTTLAAVSQGRLRVGDRVGQATEGRGRRGRLGGRGGTGPAPDPVETGSELWESKLIKGKGLQAVADPESNLLVLVTVKEPHGDDRLTFW